MKALWNTWKYSVFLCKACIQEGLFLSRAFLCGEGIPSSSSLYVPHGRRVFLVPVYSSHSTLPGDEKTLDTQTKFIVQEHRFSKSLRPMIMVLTTDQYDTVPLYVHFITIMLNAYLLKFLSLTISKYFKDTKRQNTILRDWMSVRITIRCGRNSAIINTRFLKSMVNIIRIEMEKGDSMQGHIDIVNREVEKRWRSLKKY